MLQYTSIVHYLLALWVFNIRDKNLMIKPGHLTVLPHGIVKVSRPELNMNHVTRSHTTKFSIQCVIVQIIHTVGCEYCKFQFSSFLSHPRLHHHTVQHHVNVENCGALDRNYSILAEWTISKIVTFCLLVTGDLRKNWFNWITLFF